MVGTAVGVVAPDLDGAYLVNGAGSLMHVLTESTFWDDMTSHVVPMDANGAELTFIVAMMQHYLDIADGNNFAHYYRQPPPGQDARPLGMHYSLGDGSMPNAATRATAELVDLPLLKEVIEPEPNLRAGDVGLDHFEDGYGLVQSGYGLEQAEQVKEQIKQFDPERLLGLDQSGLLGELNRLDLGDGILGDLGNELLENLGSASEVDSFDALIDEIYQGDLEDFLTHFNRGTVEAVQKSIRWRCELFQLSQTRCDMAVAKVADDQANGNPVGGGDLGGDNGPGDQLNDLVDRGLSNIQVTEGSAGALSPWLLVWLILMLSVPHWRQREEGRA